MYPITNEVKALFEAEQKQILRITGGEKSPVSKSVGPSAMASFSDAIAADALNLFVDITPVQSGSGDPSPTNVRPISGWTGVRVTRTGKNLLPNEITTATESGLTFITMSDGKIRVTGTTTYYIFKTDICENFSLPKGNYTLITSGLSGINVQICNRAENKQFAAASRYNPVIFFEVTSEMTNDMRVRFNTNTTSAQETNVTVEVMIVKSSESDATFAPYFGTTYPISWQSEAGTVYGGTLDVTTGLLTVDRGNIASYAGETLPGAWISSMDVYTAGGTPTAGAQVVYELATPVTYQLTPTQIALLEGVNNVWADCGDVTVEYATGYEYEINITDADVVIGSFRIDRFSCIGNKLEVGTATSAQMTVKLDNYDGRFNGIVFEGTELFVEIGIADWTQSNPTINWIPCGYFTPDEQPRSLKIITIHALDRMMRFDATMPTLTPWVTQSGDVMTDSQGNIIYFVSNVQFPVTVQNLVKRVALLCGVPLTQSLSNLPNYSYTLSALPTLQQEITFRNIIQWCAGIMGANAWIDWTGSLRFSWYGATTGYTSTTANRFSSDLNEDNITITGVQYTNTQNVTIVSGTADYTIDLTGNYLAAVGISTILPNIRNKVNGFTYRPFTASVINAPYLWPMDIITFNKDGTNYTCAVTNVNFGINGATALESKGETAQTNSGTAPSGVTKEQGFLIEQAAEATRKIEESMNQEGIFNLLTNNGEVQGLFLYNGKIYLNAEYIQTGTLVANLLMAGILTVGGANNGNGQIRILDADGNVIGTWNKNGISVTKGSINGPSITLGGDNNTSGTLTVKDASGNTIATINNNGVTVNKGVINGPLITLGGANNTSGTLTVKDANGNEVGEWTKDGISINNGYIKIPMASNPDNYVLMSPSNPLKVVITDSSYAQQPYSFYFQNGQIHFDNDASGNPNIYSLYTPFNIDFNNNNNSGELSAYGLSVNKQGYNGVFTYADVNGLYTQGIGYIGSYLTVAGNLSVNGTKSRVVNTDQYSERLLYCYETPSPMFGDVGEGTIGEDGKCYVWLDPVFAQTITTTQYQVFLQRYGSGECWVSERKGSYFVVEGTPGMAFGWEIKAKQRDFDQRRLERNDEPFTVPTQTYGEDAAKHIDELRKERISA